jgi:RHS repeat-associated protein
MQKTFATEEGKQYKVVFTINTIGWPSFRVQDSISDENILTTGMQLPGTHSYTFVARGSRTTLYFEEIEAVNSTLVLSSLIFFEEGKSSAYRFGFNGKENDDDVNGHDNWQDYGMRMYSPRLGRFPNPDPLIKEYPELTSYQFASNTPLWAIDLDGLEAFFIHGTKSDPFRWSRREINDILTLTNNRSFDANFAWNDPLLNGPKLRRVAANELAEYVLARVNVLHQEDVTLIGHSHGGNVIYQASEILAKRLGRKINVITICTPNTAPKYDEEDPGLKKDYINDHIHIWNTKDWVAGAISPLTRNQYGNNGITRNYRVTVPRDPSQGLLSAHFFDTYFSKAIIRLNIPRLKPARKSPTEGTGDTTLIRRKPSLD